MYRWLRCLFLLVFPLSVSTAIIGIPPLQAQQVAPASSSATPDATAPDTPPDKPADGSQPAANSTANHNANWKKDLLRDAMQMGMHKLPHDNSNRNAGGFSGGDDGNIPSPGNLTSDTSSDMHINPNIGAGIGSSDFNGNTGSTVGNSIGSGFGSGMGRPNFGGSTGLGALSQLDGDLSRGLSAGGHGSAAAALGTLPSFNQFTRGSLNLPVNSSFGSFRLSYQSPFSVTNNFQMREMNGYGSGLATYDSPHLRSSHIDFSASAKVGAGGINGGMGNGMNQGGFGAHGPDGHGGNSNDPSTSLSLHLSF